jgi:Putative bacterial sensory transduction regulator
LKQDLSAAVAVRDHRGRAATWPGIAAALVLALAPGAASARDIPSGGFTVDDIVAWLQAGGYKAQIVPGDSGGSPHVSSGAGGTNFGVYLFDCKGGRCGSIQFSTGFSTHGAFDTSKMNQWNRDNRWARGYFDSVSDPWIEMDIDLTPGGTYELLDDELATWEGSLKRFTDLYSLK